jgi:hypothetical protein
MLVARLAARSVLVAEGAVQAALQREEGFADGTGEGRGGVNVGEDLLKLLRMEGSKAIDSVGCGL